MTGRDQLLVAALAGAGRGQQIALAVDVMALLCQLSEFQQTWRLQHLHSMQAVLQASASALYSAVAALIRPNWLQNRVQLTHQVSHHRLMLCSSTAAPALTRISLGADRATERRPRRRRHRRTTASCCNWCARVWRCCTATVRRWERC